MEPEAKRVPAEPPRRALYEEIADRLEAAILGDTANVDRKLPSEPYLARSFGVSRPVIREALNILKDRGLVASRQGAPTVIADETAENFRRSAHRVVRRSGVTPEQIFEVRNALELLGVQLLAEKADPADVETLRDCNRKLRDCGDDPAACAAFDLEFHRAVTRLSGNPLLAALYEAFAALLQPLIVRCITPETHRAGITDHERILSDVARRDPGAAIEHMRGHLLLSVRNFELHADVNAAAELALDLPRG